MPRIYKQFSGAIWNWISFFFVFSFLFFFFSCIFLFWAADIHLQLHFDYTAAASNQLIRSLQSLCRWQFWIKKLCHFVDAHWNGNWNEIPRLDVPRRYWLRHKWPCSLSSPFKYLFIYSFIIISVVVTFNAWNWIYDLWCQWMTEDAVANIDVVGDISMCWCRNCRCGNGD